MQSRIRRSAKLLINSWNSISHSFEPSSIFPSVRYHNALLFVFATLVNVSSQHLLFSVSDFKRLYLVHVASVERIPSVAADVHEKLNISPVFGSDDIFMEPASGKEFGFCYFVFFLEFDVFFLLWDNSYYYAQPSDACHKESTRDAKKLPPHGVISLKYDFRCNLKK